MGKNIYRLLGIFELRGLVLDILFNGIVPLRVQVISDGWCVNRDLIKIELYLNEGVTRAKCIDIQ